MVAKIVPKKLPDCLNLSQEHSPGIGEAKLSQIAKIGAREKALF